MNAAFAHDSGRSLFERCLGIPSSASAVSAAVADTYPFTVPTGRDWSKRSLRSIETAASNGAGTLALPAMGDTNPSPPNFPRHFHLLSDADVAELRPILEDILKRYNEVVREWYQLYVLHFGDSGALSKSEFTRLFESALEQECSVLVKGDMDGYAALVSRLGRSLADHGIGLEEVIATLQLLKQIARCIFPQSPLAPRQVEAIYDKLCQVRIMLLVSAYFGCYSTTTAERTSTSESAAAHTQPLPRNRFHGLVGGTGAMRRLYQWIEAAATTKGNLLIVGESGTGKELVARAIHECGPRHGRPFVALNCAALPKDLIESELLGYKRGAFSGATTECSGLFRAAEGGSLFLDEITEMSAQTQSKLLRALQERAIRPIGATREQPVDVRVIASTNRDPKRAVVSGHLREDLYYRLQACLLTIPPLRDRREDIPLLVQHFIAIFNEDLGRDFEGIEQQALDAILKHPWPGNVRELCNAIEGAFTFGEGPLIKLADLPPAVLSSGAQRKLTVWDCSAGTGNPLATFAETERVVIARALHSVGGNKVHAARLLRISRKKLYAKIAKYELAAAAR
jgi:two-component system, NtrC family, response regulator AtoC